MNKTELLVILLCALTWLSGCADTEVRTLELKNVIDISTVNVPANSCTQITEQLYVENIKSGLIFDVYTDSRCSDKIQGELFEICDNVEPQYGNSGQLGQNKPGGAEVCMFMNQQITGKKLADKSIDVQVITFEVL